MTRPGLEPATYRLWGRRSTTGPSLRWYYSVFQQPHSSRKFPSPSQFRFGVNPFVNNELSLESSIHSVSCRFALKINFFTASFSSVCGSNGLKYQLLRSHFHYCFYVFSAFFSFCFDFICLPGHKLTFFIYNENFLYLHLKVIYYFKKGFCDSWHLLSLI